MGFLSTLVGFVSIVIFAILAYLSYLTASSASRKAHAFTIPTPAYIFVLVGVVILFGGIGAAQSFGEIPSGHLGVQRQFGGFTGVTFQPGLYTTTPMITSVDIVDLRTQSQEVDATPVTRDQQQAPMKVSINFALSNSPKDIVNLLNKNQDDYYNSVMNGALSASIRAVVSQYTLTDMLNQRDKVQNGIVQEFGNRLRDIQGTQAIQVQLINIKDIGMSQAYQDAIQKKVVALQETQAAQQVLQRIKYETQQKVVAAEGQARAQAAQARTITPDYLKLQQLNNDLEVRKTAIQQWNGVLVPFASNPFGTAPAGNNGTSGATILDARSLAALIPAAAQPQAQASNAPSAPQTNDSPSADATDSPDPQAT